MAGDANGIGQAMAVPFEDPPEPFGTHRSTLESGLEPAAGDWFVGLQPSNQLDRRGVDRYEPLVVELAERDLEQRVAPVGANAVVLEASELSDAQAGAPHQEQRPSARRHRLTE